MEKMFYSQEDLENISKDELLSLTTFGPNNEYFYSDLQSVDNVNGEFIFRFKSDTEEIYTQDAETFENVKAGKMRFDIIMKSLENSNDEFKIKDEFYTDVKANVAEELISVKENLLFNSENIKSNAINNITSIRDEVAGAIQAMQKDNAEAIKKIKGDSTTAIESVAKAVEKVNNIDIEAFNIRMEKIDKIINAFDALLED